MFDFDAGKLIIIGIVALIVIGPKDLPRVLRQVGQAVAKMRRLAAEFQGQFMEAMREADVADIKADVAKLADSAKLDVDFNPVREIRGHISTALDGSTTSPAAAEPARPFVPDETASDAESPKQPAAKLPPSATAVPDAHASLDASLDAPARHGA